MQTLKGLDPIMPLICQKSSKRTLTEGCDPVERALARPDRGRVRVRFWPSAHWDRRLSLVCAATRTETWM